MSLRSELQGLLSYTEGSYYGMHYLELIVHPRELHRDLTIWRVNYSNETHINIRINAWTITGPSCL